MIVALVLHCSEAQLKGDTPNILLSFKVNYIVDFQMAIYDLIRNDFVTFSRVHANGAKTLCGEDKNKIEHINKCTKPYNKTANRQR